LRSIVQHGDELVATRVFSSWKLIRVVDGVKTETSVRLSAATDLVQAGGRLWVADGDELLHVDGVALTSVVATAPDSTPDLPEDPPFWQITAVSGDEALLLAMGEPWRCVPGTGCEPWPEWPTWPDGVQMRDVIVDFDGRVLGLRGEELLQLDDGVWATLTPASAWEALREP
jgi:hypothetical protein